MVVTIHSSSTPQQIKRALQKLRSATLKNSKKHFDAFKFCGVITLNEDPLAIQKAMRD